MAETKEMVVPLRAAWAVPRTQRAARAIKEIRKHVARHMKVQDDEEQLGDLSDYDDQIIVDGFKITVSPPLAATTEFDKGKIS